jgi:hypothetical protein
MSKLPIEASLTADGVKAVQTEGGTARREAVTKASRASAEASRVSSSVSAIGTST